MAAGNTSAGPTRLAKRYSGPVEEKNNSCYRPIYVDVHG